MKHFVSKITHLFWEKKCLVYILFFFSAGTSQSKEEGSSNTFSNATNQNWPASGTTDDMNATTNGNDDDEDDGHSVTSTSSNISGISNLSNMSGKDWKPCAGLLCYLLFGSLRAKVS